MAWTHTVVAGICSLQNCLQLLQLLMGPSVHAVDQKLLYWQVINLWRRWEDNNNYYFWAICQHQTILANTYDVVKTFILPTFIALSINFESQAGRGGSWDICNGLDPSVSSILIVTLWTDAVPVFLPKTCWLEKQQNTFEMDECIHKRVFFFEKSVFSMRGQSTILLPHRERKVFCRNVSLFLHQVSPSLPNQHQRLRVQHFQLQWQTEGVWKQRG